MKTGTAFLIGALIASTVLGVIQGVKEDKEKEQTREALKNVDIFWESVQADLDKETQEAFNGRN